MERTAILATMGELKLYGMRAAFDAIITTAVKRQHEPQQGHCHVVWGPSKFDREAEFA